MSDFLALLVAVAFAKFGNPKDYKMPNILRKIIRDATVYFLVIFTSHFVLEMFLLFSNVSIFAEGYQRVVVIEYFSRKSCSSCRVCEC